MDTLILLLGLLVGSTHAVPVSDECPKDRKSDFTATAKAVRAAVYSGKVVITTPLTGPYELLDIVVVPKDIQAAYRQHPEATLALLLSIAEGGRPEDAMKASAYALSLVKSPALGVSIVTLFKSETYDDVDARWKKTPREYWLNAIRDVLNRRT